MGGSKGMRGRATSASCVPCSSVRFSFLHRPGARDRRILGSTTGSSVGSYRLIAPLGSGGMGEVWLAKHRLLARPAAVKLIRRTRRSCREQLVRRFEREAQATAGLRSPHSAALRLRRHQRRLLLRDGAAARHGSAAHGQPLRSPDTGADDVLLRQACRSLGEAHEHGLVHRDIKPANIFVGRLGPEYDFVKVLDFGIVKDCPTDGGDTHASTAAVVAQPHPRHAGVHGAGSRVRRPSRSTACMDIYSLGVAWRAGALMESRRSRSPTPGAKSAAAPRADAAIFDFRPVGDGDSRALRDVLMAVSRKGSGGSGPRRRSTSTRSSLRIQCDEAVDRGARPCVVEWRTPRTSSFGATDVLRSAVGRSADL